MLGLWIGFRSREKVSWGEKSPTFTDKSQRHHAPCTCSIIQYQKTKSYESWQISDLNSYDSAKENKTTDHCCYYTVGLLVFYIRHPNTQRQPSNKPGMVTWFLITEVKKIKIHVIRIPWCIKIKGHYITIYIVHWHLKWVSKIKYIVKVLSKNVLKMILILVVELVVMNTYKVTYELQMTSGLLIKLRHNTIVPKTQNMVCEKRSMAGGGRNFFAECPLVF